MDDRVIFGLLGMLVGTIFGHRLAIFRDKRQEYNNCIQPVRKSLLKVLDNPLGDKFKDVEFDDVRNILSNSKRKKLDKLIARYHDNSSKYLGKFDYDEQVTIGSDIPLIKELIEDIRNSLKPK